MLDDRAAVTNKTQLYKVVERQPHKQTITTVCDINKMGICTGVLEDHVGDTTNSALPREQ